MLCKYVLQYPPLAPPKRGIKKFPPKRGIEKSPLGRGFRGG